MILKLIRKNCIFEYGLALQIIARQMTNFKHHLIPTDHCYDAPGYGTPLR